MIELDSDIAIDEIFQKVKANKDKLIKAHFELNIRGIKKTLVDDDVISPRKIANESIQFTESGFHLFDKYTYQIQFTTF